MKTREELQIARHVVQYLKSHHIDPGPTAKTLVEFFTDSACTQHPVAGTKYNVIYAKHYDTDFIKLVTDGFTYDMAYGSFIRNAAAQTLYYSAQTITEYGRLIQFDDSGTGMDWPENCTKIVAVETYENPCMVYVYEDEACTTPVVPNKEYAKVYAKVSGFTTLGELDTQPPILVEPTVPWNYESAGFVYKAGHANLPILPLNASFMSEELSPDAVNGVHVYNYNYMGSGSNAIYAMVPQHVYQCELQ